MKSSEERLSLLCVLLVLVIEFFERIGFYGISTNLVLVSRNRFRFDSTGSIVVTLIFLGLSNIFTIFTTWIAETFLGKFNTILASCLIYNYGVAALLYLHHDNHALSIEYERIILYISLVATSVGTAGMKSNISAFGINQIKRRLKQKAVQEEKVKSFFKWFYYLINFASFISFTFISYVQVRYPFYGFLPVQVSLFLCLVLLITGRRYFICVPCSGSQFTDIFRVTKYAIKRKIQEGRQIKASLPNNVTVDLLDYAHMTYGGKYTTSQVDIVRCAVRILIMQSTIIFYWMAYFQMSTTFILQGQQMKLSISSDIDFKFPASSLTIIDIIVLLLLSIILERLIFPCLQNFRVRVTTLRKIGAGMLFGILSMIAAGLLEVYRKKFITDSLKNRYGNTLFAASSLSIAYQVPQYLLIGISEVLTTVSGLEFTYSQTPKFLHSVMMAFYLASCGIGAFISCIIIKILSVSTNWICSDLDKCQLEYFFFFTAGITFLNLIFFTILASRYSYIEDYFVGVPNIVPETSSDDRGSSGSAHGNVAYNQNE